MTRKIPRFAPSFAEAAPLHIWGTPSTLLVPRRLRHIYDRLLAQNGGRVASLLGNALKRNSQLLRSGVFPVSQRLNTRYQPSGQSYDRISFRPAPVDWLLLGQLAAAHGISRCLCFAWLLELEEEEERPEPQGIAPWTLDFDLRFPYVLRFALEYTPGSGRFWRRFASIPRRGYQIRQFDWVFWRYRFVRQLGPDQ